jgi:hypothetical protein
MAVMFEVPTDHSRTRRAIEASLKQLIDRDSLSRETPQSEKGLEHYSFPTTAEAQALLDRLRQAGAYRSVMLSGREAVVLRDASVRLLDAVGLERACGGDPQPAFLRAALPRLVVTLQTQIDSATRLSL